MVLAPSPSCNTAFSPAANEGENPNSRGEDVEEPPALIKTSPVLVTENRVEVAEAVEEATAKRVVLVSPLLACTESLAKGVVVPMPTLPVEEMKMVEVACAVPASSPTMK